MAAPTSQELDLISIFRSRILNLSLDDEQLHDQHLLRWIRAREGDISKAEEMIRRHVEWRQSNGIGPSLLDWTPSDYLKTTYQAKFCGFDKTGSPILLFTFGIWDLRPALARGEKENVRMYKDQCLEKIMKLMRLYEKQRQFHKGTLSTSPQKITQFNCICDWTGFSLRYIMNKEAVEMILEAARSFEANFPETLKAAYNVNCPKVFDVLFKLVKPFLSERTLSKIFIYDSNETKWKHNILNNLPIDQVPTRYGGTRSKIWDLADINLNLDQDGSFFDEIFVNSPGRKINLLKTGSGNELMSKDGFKFVEIPAFDKVSIPIAVTSPQTTLKWKVKVESEDGENDIDFSIFSENGGSTCRKVCVEKRHVTEEVGDLECEDVGNYWVVFTNSAVALDEPKTVFYKLALDIGERSFEKCKI